MSVRTKILEKGKIVQEQLIRFLIKLDERVTALEEGGSGGTAYDDTEVKASITALETTVGDSEGGLVKDVADTKSAIGDVSTEGTILYRLNALENP